MDTEALARHCHAAVCGDAPLPAPLAYAARVREARLDGSPGSIERMDQLIDALRTHERLTSASLAAASGGEALLILMAVNIGVTVARATRVSVEWFDRNRALSLLASDETMPDEAWTRLVGLLGDLRMVPLSLIEDNLFKPNPEMTCVAYAQRWFGRVQERASAVIADLDQNERCRAYLGAMRSGQQPPQEIAWFHEIRSLGMDGSAQSLTKLDSLLRLIRYRDKLSREDFLAEPARQDFVKWIAFYAAMTTASLGRAGIKWLNFNELSQVAPDVDFGFETMAACLCDGRLFFPIGLVSEILFEPTSARTLAGWSAALQASVTHRFETLEVTQPDEARVSLDAHWLPAVRQAGWAAAFELDMLADGGKVSPKLHAPDGEGKLFIRDFGFYEDQAQAMAALESGIEHNPDKWAYQIMVTDGYANLPSGRTDSVSLDLRCYAGGVLSRRKPLQLLIACPYGRTDQPGGFHSSTPVLLTCSEGASLTQSVAQAFHDGMRSFSSARSSSTG